MNSKTILYMIIIPISIWIVLALRIETFFKKNKTNQIIIFSIFLSLGIAYLVVNFIVDFYEVSKLLK